jgi:hypothetical protein
MNAPINDLNQLDKTMHSVAQLIALTAMQTLPALPDDSQTNMAWNSTWLRLEGRPFTMNNQSVQLVLDTPSFALQFIDEQGQVLASFSLEGQTPTDTMNWWKAEMRARGFSDNTPLNYKLDHPPIDLQTPYISLSGLADWQRGRTLANRALNELNAWSGEISEVRVWPHHFDTGVYYSRLAKNGQERAAIWTGYAIADALNEAPYFYLSGYTRQQSLSFSVARPLSVGEWRQTADWQGALLSITDVTNEYQVNSFFRESYQWLNGQIIVMD